MEINGQKPKNHIIDQKNYIRKLEEKNKMNKELKAMADGKLHTNE